MTQNDGCVAVHLQNISHIIQVEKTMTRNKISPIGWELEEGNWTVDIQGAGKRPRPVD